ncbi:MAG: LPS export ABC transporter periplasmic protein LptC [Spirochaetes bacterium GWF1_41_5]|nr:MAG: LPS export ABC transporter periplasmic protein LptC [Spirochaetes bacterium GWF1_41_5]HBE01386.1 LPS export ABC transporter periplasmic protein LptC [Spirochaetia bacterium]
MNSSINKIIIIFIAFLAFFTGSCSNELTIKPKIEAGFLTNSTLEDLIISNFVTEELKLGSKRWQLSAKLARIYRSENRIEIENLNLETYSSRGKTTSSILSDLGILYTTSRNVELISNVVIKSSNGTVLKGDKFFWNNTSEELSTREPADIIRANGDIMHAKNGLLADKALEKITLHRVKGRAASDEIHY